MKKPYKKYKKLEPKDNVLRAMKEVDSADFGLTSSDTIRSWHENWMKVEEQRRTKNKSNLLGMFLGVLLILTFFFIITFV